MLYIEENKFVLGDVCDKLILAKVGFNVEGIYFTLDLTKDF